METTFAREAAVSSAVDRFAKELVWASTRTILQLGQIPCAVSRSSAASSDQPLLVRYFRTFEPPSWFTLLKQPFAVVHPGNEYCELKTFRSFSAVA